MRGSKKRVKEGEIEKISGRKNKERIKWQEKKERRMKQEKGSAEEWKKKRRVMRR